MEKQVRIRKKPIISSLRDWRVKHIGNRQLVLILSFVIGLISGLAALILKTIVHATHLLVTQGFEMSEENLLLLAYPLAGITLTVLFVKYFIRDNISHGVSRILFSISRQNGILRQHNSYSSMIGSTLTVGFGGSVGLEAPIVLTGASIGSNIGRIFRLEYKSLVLLIGCGAAGAIAGIFKAPIAGLVFTLEVLMLDLTMSSIIPLLISAVTAATLTQLLMGESVIFAFEVDGPFLINQVPFYILLGIFTGFVSLYFSRVSMYTEALFRKIIPDWQKILIGGLLIGLLVFLLPALYGEGYSSLRELLNGSPSELLANSPFFRLSSNTWLFIVFIAMILILKPIAMAATTGAGGVGGIFAPSLFSGGIAGFLLARIIGNLGFTGISERNFALAGMAGMMAAVMHAPLTGIFLIAEITGGYELFIPLIITATIAFLTIIRFEPHSIYTKRLAERGELFTHDKDKAALSMMSVNKLIEKNFLSVHPDNTLGELVKVISKSQRNVFPVLDEEGLFLGVVFVNDIREIIFQPELYNSTFVRDLMFMPSGIVSPDDSMEEVARKFQESGNYNLPVLKEGKYLGFVSRAKVFSSYRNLLRNFMEE